MAKNKRLLWVWLMCVGVLALLAAGAGLGSGGAVGVPRLQATDNNGLPREMGGPEYRLEKGETPIFAAGGLQGVWLCIPRKVMTDGKPGAYFEMWQHPRHATEGGKDLWKAVVVDGWRYRGGVPQDLAAVPAETFSAADGRTRERLGAYLLFDGMWVRAFGNNEASDKEEIRNGREDLRGVAISGTGEAVFVLAINHVPGSEMSAASAPETTVAATTMVATTAAATRAASTSAAPATTAAATGAAPATTASATTAASANAAQEWVIVAKHDKIEEDLTPLGTVGASDTPSAHAQVALVATLGKLTVAWHEPGDGQPIRVRTLATKILRPATEPAASTTAATTEKSPTEPKWSKMQETHVGEPIARVMGLAVDGRAVVAWPAKHAKDDQFDLRGVVIQDDGAIAIDGDGKAKQGPMFPMQLEEMSEGMNPLTDVALAQSGTALCAIVYRKDGTIKSRLFASDRAEAVGPAQVVAPAVSPKVDSAVIQNIMLFLMVTLVAVSLWQWRMRPAKVSVPRGMAIASLRVRGIAAAIDFAIPLVAVLAYEAIAGSGDWMGLLKAWAGEFLAPADLYSEHPILLFILGGFLLHVTIGEMFTGRSIGKMFVGSRVVATDGTPAKIGAIFLRNLVKLFEVTTGILLIYIFISEHRQRLGDLLARTMVIAPPENKKEDGAKKE